MTSFRWRNFPPHTTLRATTPRMFNLRFDPRERSLRWTGPCGRPPSGSISRSRLLMSEMMAASMPDIPTLARKLRTDDRATLARAITLVESKRADHQQAAHRLVQELIGETGKAVRVGITGAPGAGKSTTIDTLGTYLTEKDHKVAVLAVDPSSTRTGGSILGDKTRMSQLATDPNAFVRPSPSSGTLGGVAAKTRETMLLCEAA